MTVVKWNCIINLVLNKLACTMYSKSPPISLNVLNITVMLMNHNIHRTFRYTSSALSRISDFCPKVRFKLNCFKFLQEKWCKYLFFVTETHGLGSCFVINMYRQKIIKHSMLLYPTHLHPFIWSSRQLTRIPRNKQTWKKNKKQT